MKMGKDAGEETRILERTLNFLGRRKKAPLHVLIILSLLYLAVSITVSISAGSDKVVMFGGKPLEVYTFAGVLSSVANLCLILMVEFCGKAGFIAAITILAVQVPLISIGIFVKGNITSLPGLFGIVLMFIAVIIIALDNRRMDEYQQRLREQASTDALTGLPNGFASTELIDELIKRGKPFAAVTIDINGFKNINDIMGFTTGNKVLIEIARRWRKIADESLSGTTDFITRINGDEYSLIIRDLKPEDDVFQTIRVYEAALDEKVCVDGYEVFLNASFGYALYPDDSRERDSLLSYAVSAMKEIKRIGSSEHILRFTPELLKGRDHLVIDNKVREAMEKDRFYFHLQPQFDLSHHLRGFEALARMTDSEGNTISPDEFIPAAERTGLIDGMDLLIYRKAAAFFGDLLKQTKSEITLSINVSVKHLMKSNYTEEIRDLLSESGIPPRQLEIEITESIWIESPEKAAACLNELKDMGIRIAIDDFGTGYSSLSYLSSFPFDILKIDKSFIDMMNESDSSEKYIEAIISLAHVLDLKVIAEGVEEPEQLEVLRGIGCDYIQGFIWGKPLPKEEAEKLVARMG